MIWRSDVCIGKIKRSKKWEIKMLNPHGYQMKCLVTIFEMSSVVSCFPLYCTVHCTVFQCVLVYICSDSNRMVLNSASIKVCASGSSLLCNIARWSRHFKRTHTVIKKKILSDFSNWSFPQNEHIKFGLVFSKNNYIEFFKPPVTSVVRKFK